MAAVGARFRLRGLAARGFSGPAAAPLLPHRRHPGISRLPAVRLPEPLSQGVRLLLQKYPIRQLEESARELTDFLWSRKRAVEDRELQERAQRLWERLAESSRAGPGSPTQGDEDRADERLQQRLMAELRKTTYRWKPVSYNEHLALAYIAGRLDGGYAALTRVLQEIKKRAPGFRPRTLLDFGSGTGTVTWVSRVAWGDWLREYLCVDTSAEMHQAAEFLMRGGSDADTEEVSGVYFRHFLPVSPKVKFDLVVSAYSLCELPSLAERLRVVETLWRKTEGFLVLIENGTKEGHQILMEAREAVLKADEEEPKGHVFAPCPHDLICPKLLGKVPVPCNFAQAYHPLPFAWNKGVKLEKFSYVVLRRGGPREESGTWPRLVQPALRRTRHVHAHLCCADGTLCHTVITPRKSGRDLYRWARNCSWGDRLPVAFHQPACRVTGRWTGNADG